MNDQDAKELDLEWVLSKVAAKKATQSLLPTPPAPKVKKDLTATKKNESDLWHTWKSSGHQAVHLDPLLKSLKPLVEKQASKFKGRVEIPIAAIDHEFKQQTVAALKSYDPKKGQLSSWVTNYLKKAGRFINNNQNFARITEPIANKIGTYKAARAELTDKLGHEPDSEALMKHTGFSKKEISRLQKDIRKALVATGTEEEDLMPAQNFSDRDREVIDLIYHQLTPQERVVHEYTFGLNGKASLKTSAIAKKMKWDDSKVSKIKTAINNKMKPYLV
jgi:DNA-directed RNA polymerase specialized sigma subunit